MVEQRASQARVAGLTGCDEAAHGEPPISAVVLTFPFLLSSRVLSMLVSAAAVVTQRVLLVCVPLAPTTSPSVFQLAVLLAPCSEPALVFTDLGESAETRARAELDGREEGEEQKVEEEEVADTDSTEAEDLVAV